VSGVALAMVLAACSSGSSGNGSSNTSTTGASSGGQASAAPSGGGSSAAPGSAAASGGADAQMQQLATAAKAEGSLNWYTTFSDKQLQPFIAAFNKVYPDIKVNALRLSADQIPARIGTEQKGGKFNADVVSGDSPQVAQLLQAGELQPYTPPDLPPAPAGLKLPDGYQTIVYTVTTVIAYNPAQVKAKGLTPPTSWQDLTKPEWKGQFSVDDGAVNWYESMVAQLGHDKALQLITDLGNNSPRLVSSHTQALTQVESGEPVATAMAYGYLASADQKKSPGSIAFVNMNPLPSSLNLVDLVKKAPHPNAAKLFIAWIVSQDGQQTVVDVTNHTSTRTDVKNDANVWDPSKWPPVWGDPNLPADTYNSYVKEMKTAFHAP
jgi:iron(III) transport system substrate-binding protein